MQIFLLTIMSEQSQSLLFTCFCIFIYTFFLFLPSLKHKCCLQREAVITDWALCYGMLCFHMRKLSNHVINWEIMRLGRTTVSLLWWMIWMMLTEMHQVRGLSKTLKRFRPLFTFKFDSNPVSPFFVCHYKCFVEAKKHMLDFFIDLIHVSPLSVLSFLTWF